MCYCLGYVLSHAMVSTPEGYPTRDIEAGEGSEEGDQTRWFNLLEICVRVETNYEV